MDHLSPSLGRAAIWLSEIMGSLHLVKHFPGREEYFGPERNSE
jgi:hypothetical protein